MPTPIQSLLTQDIMKALKLGSYEENIASQDTYLGYVSSHTSPFPVLRMPFDSAVKLPGSPPTWMISTRLKRSNGQSHQATLWCGCVRG
ncbi:Hypothetical protein, putative [Bodo saltans]|uniref:Uncharacterized protein n=1 Tax=Bodo saltans TaxID=75058 RepID=A0A0S4ISC0_BODSA|nr:Hypothetical protein, putative [Bodo saltans]|eukprot:CUF56477.1 Hypothetical protein, putative [Bodo saltans]